MTEENLKLESDTFALKRDYKYALENLANVKKDTVEAISIKEKVTIEVTELKEEKQKILNQISDEKVSWAQHRNEELLELERKDSEAQNVLKRKGELNTQEEDIRKITAKNQEILNDIRTLEFKLEQDKTAVEVEKNKVKNLELNVTRREEKLLQDKQNFKEKVVKVLESVHEL